MRDDARALAHTEYYRGNPFGDYHQYPNSLGQYT